MIARAGFSIRLTATLRGGQQKRRGRVIATSDGHIDGFAVHGPVQAAEHGEEQEQRGRRRGRVIATTHDAVIE